MKDLAGIEAANDAQIGKEWAEAVNAGDYPKADAISENVYANGGKPSKAMSDAYMAHRVVGPVGHEVK
jgi:hypothetical protein